MPRMQGRLRDELWEGFKNKDDPQTRFAPEDLPGMVLTYDNLVGLFRELRRGRCTLESLAFRPIVTYL